MRRKLLLVLTVLGLSACVCLRPPAWWLDRGAPPRLIISGERTEGDTIYHIKVCVHPDENQKPAKWAAHVVEFSTLPNPAVTPPPPVGAEQL